MKNIIGLVLLTGLICTEAARGEFVLEFIGSGDSSWVDIGGGSNIATWSTANPGSVSSYYDRFIANVSAIVTNAPLLVGDQFRLSGTYSLHGSSALGQLFFTTSFDLFGFTLSNDDDAGLDLIRLWVGNGGSPVVTGLVGVDVGDTFDFDVDGSGVAQINYDVYFVLGSGGDLTMSGTVSDGSGPRYTFSTNFTITTLGSPPASILGVVVASDMIAMDDNTQGSPQLIADPITRLQWGYSVVPEPTTALLGVVGAGALALRARARSRARAGYASKLNAITG